MPYFRTSEAFARRGVRQRTTSPNAHGSRWICSSELQIEPLFSYKVGDVVSLGSEESGKWGWGFSKEVRERSEQVLEEVDLSDFKNRSWQALSGGELQRVLIARAMMSELKLLLLDEPSANLDLASKTILYDFLHRVNENTTVLVSTHDLGLVPLIAKSVVTVNHFLHYHSKPEIT